MITIHVHRQIKPGETLYIYTYIHTYIYMKDYAHFSSWLSGSLESIVFYLLAGRIFIINDYRTLSHICSLNGPIGAIERCFEVIHVNSTRHMYLHYQFAHVIYTQMHILYLVEIFGQELSIIEIRG